jgi:hypothetical protein
MIILLHGTGDDDEKTENWMRWVGQIAEEGGEHVLVLPGVGSSQAETLAQRAHDFIFRLQCLEGHRERRGAPSGFAVPQGLTEAIEQAASARSELRPLLRGRFDSADEQIDAVNEVTRGESIKLAIGIKTRAALATICARRYFELAENPTTIRIVGHSRGGAAAIATLNVLRYFGHADVRVVALDPCHGLKKLGAKPYTHVVYSGTVVNLPAVKEVANYAIPYTLRQRITLGDGADASARVVNDEPLESIEHGFMGKLVAFPKAGFFTSRAEAQRRDARKKHGQALIQRDATALISQREMRDQVNDLFALAQDHKGDLADKRVIFERVCWGLFGPSTQALPVPPLVSRPRYSLIDAYRAIGRSAVGAADKGAIVAKLETLRAAHPALGLEVVGRLALFKLAESDDNGLPDLRWVMDEYLHGMRGAILDAIAVAGPGSEARFPTPNELMVLVRNSSHFAQRAIPSTFKAYLNGPPAAELRTWFETHTTARGCASVLRFLERNGVVLPGPRRA